ncbi:MAG: DUF927 domain-containing protein [Anaerolineales bacterium]|nr:DUF927 domain-containing protein [Chloroflexota bacterium]MBL6982714.1 DUF927 domain-containing protein [Anaerolineales bacterium]
MPTSIDIEKLLDHIDIVALADHLGASLQKKSREWRGACPLHTGADNETAFQVSIDNDHRGYWRCWTGCDTGGDAIDLVRYAKNMGFIEAVEYLANYAGIDLEDIGMTPEAAKAYEKRKQHTNILDLAARYFATRLWSEDGRHCLEYARTRGFSDDALRMAGWGFSDGGTGLYDYLVEVGADISLAREIGLIRADGRDFTVNGDGDKASPEGWLVYPHSERSNAKVRECGDCEVETWHHGRHCLRHESEFSHIQGITYVSARALNQKAEGGDKSRNLPGQRQPYKAEMPGVREVILCEGPADAESYRQMGFSAWALCGLGHLPGRDFQLLRQRPVVYLAFDGDAIGQEKQSLLAPVFGPLAMLVMPIEGYKDANDFYRSSPDPSLITALLENATPVIEQCLGKIKHATPHKLQEFTGELLDLLKQLPSEVAPRYLGRTQRALGMTRKELRTMISETERQDGKAPVLSEVKDGQLHFLGKPLANFAACITHELTVDDGLNLPEVHYTIQGILSTHEPMRTLNVPAADFADMKWIHRYWGARPILYVPRGNYYLVARAMQESSLEDMQRERVFTHTGWTEMDGGRGFLTAGGMITADSYNDSVRVDLGENNLRHYNLPEPPKGEQLARAVKASLNFLDLGPMCVTAPVWAAMYGGPLTEIRPLYTVIWLYGPTQSGKSTLAHLALTHFGMGFIEGRQYHAPDDWMSTVTHIEGVLFSTKDVPVVIDDFAPQFQSAADSRRMHKSAHQVVRAVGNRSARGRANRDLSERKTRVPRGMVLSTAELPLAGESTVGRMVYVPIARGEVLPNTGEPLREELDKTQMQAKQGLYAQAMAAYVQWLAANWERASKLYLEIIEESHKLARDGRMQNRLPDYFATLDAAQQVTLIAFTELGALSSIEASSFAERNSQAILQVIENQAEKIAAESPVRKFFEALDNLIQRRKVYLEPRSGGNITPPPEADPVGWYEVDDESVFYLDTKSCMIHVREFWGQLGEYFDTTKDALHRQFNQIGGLLIETGEGSHIQVSKWVTSAGKSVRMVAFDLTKVQELYGVTIKNPSPPRKQTENSVDVGKDA